MIKLFLNIHFIKKHPSKVKFSVSKCNNFKMQGKFFFEIRQNVTELQISKVTRIFEFHLKATFSENTQTNTFLKTIKVRVKSVSRTPTLPVVFSHKVLTKVHQKSLSSLYGRLFNVSLPSTLNSRLFFTRSNRILTFRITGR